MSTPHTPEPWKVGGEPCDDWGMIRGADGGPVADAGMCYRYTDEEANQARRTDSAPPTIAANAERIVSCVNACTGMADPEATITALREALKEIVGHRNETIDGAGHRYTFDYRSPMAERARAALKLAGER